jgi:hypothetical protein
VTGGRDDWAGVDVEGPVAATEAHARRIHSMTATREQILAASLPAAEPPEPVTPTAS